MLRMVLPSSIGFTYGYSSFTPLGLLVPTPKGVKRE